MNDLLVAIAGGILALCSILAAIEFGVVLIQRAPGDWDGGDTR